MRQGTSGERPARCGLRAQRGSRWPSERATSCREHLVLESTGAGWQAGRPSVAARHVADKLV
jgi:hypothetical protein